MDRDIPKPNPNAQWIELAQALGDMRDSLVMLSLALHDFVTEMPSTTRDQVKADVERYLALIGDSTRRNIDSGPD